MENQRAYICSGYVNGRICSVPSARGYCPLPCPPACRPRRTSWPPLPNVETVIDVKDVLRLVGPAVEAYRRRVRNLPETIRQAPDVARKVIRGGVGPIVVAPRDGYLVAKLRNQVSALAWLPRDLA